MKKKKIKKVSWPRKIIHIDMDAFFAAIEQRDQPELRGKPVIVGGDPKSRGVVSTCSYEARVFGVRSAMPCAQAYRLCPQGIFVRPRMRAYREASDTVMAILRQHTELVEEVSVDEAYLDVTQNRLKIEDPRMVATLIKQNIHAATGLTASAGVAANMFLAKIGSDFKKPDGLTVIEPGSESLFLEPLAVRKIPGVGPVAEKELHARGLYTCGDIATTDPVKLEKWFGSYGLSLYRRARGNDEREISPWSEPKQSSVEETFDRDTRNLPLLKEKLKAFSLEVFEDLVKKELMGNTVVLKLKYHDFEQITRSKTLSASPQGPAAIYEIASWLLEHRTGAAKKAVRLIGLGVSGLRAAADVRRMETPDLFQVPLTSPNENERRLV